MEQIVPYVEKYSYVGIFGMMILFSFVVPFSKTLVVVAGGVLAAEELADLYLIMLVSFLGLVTADSIYFWIGARWGERLLSMGYFSRKGRRERLLEAQSRFMEHGWFAVFSARFTPFLRGLIFLVAGASRMPYLRFIQADGLSAILMVPIAALTGYLVAEKRSIVYDYISEAEYVLAALLAVIIVLAFVFPRRIRRKQTRG